MLIILWHIMSINSPINLKRLDIIIVNCDFNVIVIREESKAEVLKQILFQVIDLGRTEVVEAFDLLEGFADIRTEVHRNTNDSEMIRGVRNYFSEILNSRDHLCIADISQHDHSVLHMFFC